MTGQVALQAAVKVGQRVLQNPLVQDAFKQGVEVVSRNILPLGKEGGLKLVDVFGNLIQSGTQSEAIVRAQDLIRHVSNNAEIAKQFLGGQAGQFDGLLKQLGEFERLIGNAGEGAIQDVLQKHLLVDNPKLLDQLTEFDSLVKGLKDKFGGAVLGTDGASASGLLEQASAIEVGGQRIVVDKPLIDATRTQVNGQRTEVIDKVLNGAEEKLANGVPLDQRAVKDIEHVAGDFGVQAGDAGKTKAVVSEARDAGRSTVGKAEIIDEPITAQSQVQQNHTTNPNDVRVDDVDVDVKQGADDFTRGRSTEEPQIETSADANNANKRSLPEGEVEKEVERRVQERLKELEAQGGVKSGNIPDDPIEKILHGAESIVADEFKNLSSEVGLIMRATGMTPDKVNGLMRKFVTPEFRNELAAFLKAQLEGHPDPLSVISHLGPKEQQAVKWLGRLVNIGAKTPSWAFDAIAFGGNLVDYFDWALRHLPGGKFILGIPFMRKFITGFGQFVGRFSGNIKLIGEGVKDFQGTIAKTTSSTAMGAEAIVAASSATSK
ncbi:MAG: hypothetical protein HYR97_01555 [Candidatus Melainabacteria bacterium]|nr:hypothetical protein [Candidatus Melainabacteria bacterium]